ncbi:hypothetical protein N836_01090 [Leptolyngbya sp. Heron Island J]|uniref:hypothetical protein n=1 Tax=Leptolyngbya sp. Heron Island J TaxID=1385935 RepID=UPI0003B9DDB5|nr:hypothetical protein [Leptolyngbya sp. Heron Island J]ESA35774.1 hypothetical protein N836_01090 [Leptolyngbya sp. Heron Island J]
MQPFREKTTQQPVNNLPFTLIANPQIGLALATLPCLGLLILGRTLTYGLVQFGMASEEIFRGIQLPVLDADPHRPL